MGKKLKHGEERHKKDGSKLGERREKEIKKGECKRENKEQQGSRLDKDTGITNRDTIVGKDSKRDLKKLDGD